MMQPNYTSTLSPQAKIKALSSDIHQLQLVKLYYFELDIFWIDLVISWELVKVSFQAKFSMQRCRFNQSEIVCNWCAGYRDVVHACLQNS